jgi:hypothetical protein
MITMSQNKQITFQDLEELPVFHKRTVFMDIFFQVHNNQPEDNLKTIISSYHKAELIFIKRYGAKGWKSDESFLRTYYYYLNSKNVSK